MAPAGGSPARGEPATGRSVRSLRWRRSGSWRSRSCSERGADRTRQRLPASQRRWSRERRRSPRASSRRSVLSMRIGRSHTWPTTPTSRDWRGEPRNSHRCSPCSRPRATSRCSPRAMDRAALHQAPTSFARSISTASAPTRSDWVRTAAVPSTSPFVMERSFGRRCTGRPGSSRLRCGLVLAQACGLR